MSFNSGFSFNPRNLLAKPTVRSSLVSRRELGSSWRDDAQSLHRGGRNTNVAGQLQRQVNAIQVPGKSTGGFTPFQIYQFPSSLRVFQPDDAPQRFKVRGGLITSYSSFAPFWFDGNVFGTDGCVDLREGGSQYVNYLTNQDFNVLTDEVETFKFQIPPADDALVSFFWNEALIPNDNSTWYFWISLTASKLSGDTSIIGPVMCYGTGNFYNLGSGYANPTTAIEMKNGTAFSEIWPTFPLADPYHFPIGSVSILNGNVWINQFVFDNLRMPFNNLNENDGSAYSGCADTDTRFRGAYDDSIFYYTGDLVTDTFDSDGDVGQFMMFPPSASSSAFFNGPIMGIRPSENNPDPWTLLSKFTPP